MLWFFDKKQIQTMKNWTLGPFPESRFKTEMRNTAESPFQSYWWIEVRLCLLSLVWFMSSYIFMESKTLQHYEFYSFEDEQTGFSVNLLISNTNSKRLWVQTKKTHTFFMHIYTELINMVPTQWKHIWTGLTVHFFEVETFGQGTLSDEAVLSHTYRK